MLEKLLDDIVAKYIHHKLYGIGTDLLEDTFLLVTVCRL